MKTVCVAHLVRAANGPAVFERFLSSYRRHGAGIPHRLLLLLKGFRDSAELLPYERLLGDLPHGRLRVRDFGYDIRPYVLAARETAFDRYCFLNSFSIILASDWLAKLADHLDDYTGVVGATGSWASHLTIPAGETEFRYKGLVLRRPAFVARWGRKAKLAFLGMHFDPHPNPHVRTNAFLVRRELMLPFASRRLLTKLDVYGFESARWGLSAMARARGLSLRVVGADGRAYGEEEWPESNTYWQGDQENLLVADNQTARYQGAELEERTFLSRLAWAERARPAPPGEENGAP